MIRRAFLSAVASLSSLLLPKVPQPSYKLDLKDVDDMMYLGRGEDGKEIWVPLKLVSTQAVNRLSSKGRTMTWTLRKYLRLDTNLPLLVSELKLEGTIIASNVCWEVSSNPRQFDTLDSYRNPSDGHPNC